MKPVFFFSILLFSLNSFSAKTAHAATLCSMTFNSPDEKGVLSQFYGQAHELVPNSKDPNWLKTACQSKVKCDILVISGHFGGLFFGEKTSPTLDLNQLEEVACQESCPSILNAKSVYLMGCNTLATKAPDFRFVDAIDDYLHVLVQDGFPRNLAEDVVESRYSDYGLSMAQRMSIAFPNATSLYGFSSAGPLGAEAAPLLRKGLSGSLSNPDASLLSAFQNTSFRVAKPTEEITPEARTLSCQLRSQNSGTKTQAFQSVLTQKDPSPYFDQLLNQSDAPELINAWNAASSDAIRTEIESVASRIDQTSSVLTGVRFKILKLRMRLGLLSESDYFSKTNAIISDRLKTNFDYLALDQICEIAKSDSNLPFNSTWFNLATDTNRSYYARLAGCFAHLDDRTLSALKSLALNSPDPFTRREALRSLGGKWSGGEVNTLLQAASHWSAMDQYEAHASLSPSTNPAPKSPGGDATARDNQRWNQYQASHPASLEVCQNIAAQFETQIGLGVDWDCFTKFKKSVTLSAAIKAASHYENSRFAKYSPEKADDFIFNVWDQLRSNSSVNRSECLGFTQALVIEGDRIKQNWNCMNQISQ